MGRWECRHAQRDRQLWGGASLLDAEAGMQLSLLALECNWAVHRSATRRVEVPEVPTLARLSTRQVRHFVRDQSAEVSR